MSQFLEFFYLLYLNIRFKCFEYVQQKAVQNSFYKDPFYKSVDTAICSSINPYKVPKAFPYGETPILLYKSIGDAAFLKPSDTVLELGCGRGRGLFFLRTHFKCTCIGVDFVPEFIERAKAVTESFAISRLFFISANMCQDLDSTHFQNVSFVYLYGTALSEAAIGDLKKFLFKLKKGTKIFTVSYPLEGLKLEKIVALRFPWGTADGYLQVL